MGGGIGLGGRLGGWGVGWDGLGGWGGRVGGLILFCIEEKEKQLGSLIEEHINLTSLSYEQTL